MALLDYLLVYPDRETAIADLADYSAFEMPLWLDDEGGNPVLNGSYAFEPRVYVVTGDGERSYLAHYYIWLTLPERDAVLEARQSFGLVADREAFEAGDPGFVRATNFTAEQLGASFIEPVLMGAQYPFGAIAPPE